VMAAPYATFRLLMQSVPMRAEIGEGWGERLLPHILALPHGRRVVVPAPGTPGVVLCSGERCLLPARTAGEIQKRAEQIMRGEDDVGESPRIFIERIPTDEDLVRYLEALARRRKLHTAWISGIGAVRRASLATYDQTARKYEPVVFEEPFELLSLQGNLSLRDGEPFAHVHVVLARRDGTTVGGHVLEGTVVFLTELMITEKEGPALQRHPDEVTGLSVWPRPEA